MTDMSQVEWSNSSLTCLQQCGEKFRRRYIEKERVPPSPRMLRGTVVHHVASTAYRRKIDTATLPSVEEARDLAATSFERTWDQGVLFSREDTATGPGIVRADSKDFAIDLAGYHVATVAPAITPTAVERKIIVKPKDSDLVIHGTIDLIDQQAAGEVIRDLKTSDRMPRSDVADVSQQLTMYALIRLAEVGTLPASLVLDFLVRSPERATKRHVPLTTTRDREDLRALVDRINTAAAAVEAGVFVPAPPDAWWCSRAWCEYFDTCIYVRRGERRGRQED